MRLHVLLILLVVSAGFAMGQQKPAEIDLCSALRPGFTSIGPIRIRALMTWSKVTRVDGDDPVIYSEKCNNRDHFATPDFTQLRDSRSALRVLKRLPTEKRYTLEIDATGTLAFSSFPIFGHLSWSRFEFRGIKIHSLLDVSTGKKVAEPDFESDAPEIDLATHLEFVNAEVMLYVLGAPGLPEVGKFFSDEFTALDPAGRKYTRNELKDLANVWFGERSHSNSLAVGRDTLSVDEEIYKTRGKMWIKTLDGEKRELMYENTFIRVNNSFRLVRTRLTKP